MTFDADFQRGFAQGARRVGKAARTEVEDLYETLRKVEERLTRAIWRLEIVQADYEVAVDDVACARETALEVRAKIRKAEAAVATRKD